MLAVIGCADGPSGPASPSAVSTASLAVTGTGSSGSSLAASSPRNGDLNVIKNCSEYHGAAGEFCTVTLSSLEQVEFGSRIIYAQPAGAASLDSDVVLDTPGPGQNKAFGHCRLDFSTLTGRCTFSGGTGKFTSFRAGVDVSYVGGNDWAWRGSYSFNPND
jgi:hypothetical protein